MVNVQPLLVLPDGAKLEDVPVLNRYYKITVPPDTDLAALAPESWIFLRWNSQYPTTYCRLLVFPTTRTSKAISGYWMILDRQSCMCLLPGRSLLGAPSVVVAVLDTGLDISHRDIDAKNTGNGYNFVGNNTDIRDDKGHGTEVAGIIGAETNNGTDVAGMSWGAMIMPVKVCDSTGDCPADTIMNGIR